MDGQIIVLDSAAFSDRITLNSPLSFYNTFLTPLDNEDDQLEVGLIGIILQYYQAIRRVGWSNECGIIKPYQSGDMYSRVIRASKIYT